MMNHKPDHLDAASEYTEAFTQQSIENVLKKGGEPVLPFKGTCYNCLANITKPRRFCDEECADEYSYVQARRNANK